jgi:hypothetical protein
MVHKAQLVLEDIWEKLANKECVVKMAHKAEMEYKALLATVVLTVNKA